MGWRALVRKSSTASPVGDLALWHYLHQDWTAPWRPAPKRNQARLIPLHSAQTARNTCCLPKLGHNNFRQMCPRRQLPFLLESEHRRGGIPLLPGGDEHPSLRTLRHHALEPRCMLPNCCLLRATLAANSLLIAELQADAAAASEGVPTAAALLSTNLTISGVSHT